MQRGLGDRKAVCPSVKRVNCNKTKSPKEKSSITTNSKFTTSFSVSPRQTAYVDPIYKAQKRKKWTFSA